MNTQKPLKKKKTKIIFLLLMLFFLTFFLLWAIQPLDNKGFKTQEFYKKTLQNFENEFFVRASETEEIQAAWAKKNITPETPQRLAGYGLREKFACVRDSSFVKAIVMKIGNKKMLWLNFDLLIVHRDLKNSVEKLFAQNRLYFDFIFYTATHTHHGTGGWASGISGFAAGGYDEEVFKNIAAQSYAAVEEAVNKTEKVKVKYFQTAQNGAVRNRVDENSYADDKLRCLIFEKNNGKKFLWATFSAHATCLSSDYLCLSSDYAGDFIRCVEAQKDFEAAIFAAGAVGSQAPTVGGYPDETAAYGENLAKSLLSVQFDTLSVLRGQFAFAEMPLNLPKGQFRISKNLRIQPEIFEFVFGKLTGKIQMLKFDKLIFLTYPCDISAELYPKLQNVAEKSGHSLIMTSFNGDYVGYVSHSKHFFEKTHPEIKDMNWLGHDAYEFFEEISLKMLSNKFFHNNTKKTP